MALGQLADSGFIRKGKIKNSAHSLILIGRLSTNLIIGQNTTFVRPLHLVWGRVTSLNSHFCLSAKLPVGKFGHHLEALVTEVAKPTTMLYILCKD